jgi:hypothetical protein
MHDHLNYARTGPGAARGITVLRGDVVAVDNSEAIVSFVAAGGKRTIRFFFDPNNNEWKRGQAVEITIASFDA